MSDTFKALISDMRNEEPDVDEVSRDTVVATLDTYADRLEKLLDELNPYLLPMYGEVGTVEPIDSDPPPILADMLGSEPPPGSDWTLVHPVQPTVAEFLAREADEAEAAADDPVTGDT